MKISRTGFLKAAAAAGVALAALGTAGVAQARSNVYFSVGAQVAPGVSIGVSSGPSYYAPAYYAPPPVYVQPAPVYYEPVYYAPAPVYYAPPVVTYIRPWGGHRHHGRHWR